MSENESSTQEPPKIEFPCNNYPIKIIGESSESYYSRVLSVIDKHAPGFDQSKTTTRDSNKGRFLSVTVFITATGVPQLEAIFEDLKSLKETRMVL